MTFFASCIKKLISSFIPGSLETPKFCLENLALSPQRVQPHPEIRGITEAEPSRIHQPTLSIQGNSLRPFSENCPKMKPYPPELGWDREEISFFSVSSQLVPVFLTQSASKPTRTFQRAFFQFLLMLKCSFSGLVVGRAGRQWQSSEAASVQWGSIFQGGKKGWDIQPIW